MKKTIREVAEKCDVLVGVNTNLSFFLVLDEGTDNYNLQDDDGHINEENLSPELEVTIEQGDKHTYVNIESNWYYLYTYSQSLF